VNDATLSISEALLLSTPIVYLIGLDNIGLSIDYSNTGFCLKFRYFDTDTIRRA